MSSFAPVILFINAVWHGVLCHLTVDMVIASGVIFILHVLLLKSILLATLNDMDYF